MKGIVQPDAVCTGCACESVSVDSGHMANNRPWCRWAPLHFKGSYWNVAEDELDVVAAYYRLQARTQPVCAAALVLFDPAALVPLITFYHVAVAA